MRVWAVVLATAWIAGSEEAEALHWAAFDLQRAVEQVDEAPEIRRRIRQRKARHQARADGLRARFERRDPKGPDRRMDRRSIHRAIERMEEELDALQEKLLAPVIRRLEARSRRLAKDGRATLDLTGRRSLNLPSACDRTDWLASASNRAPPLDRRCRRRALVWIQPDVAFAATAAARAATERLDRLRDRLQARLDAGRRTPERARALQRDLEKAEAREAHRARSQTDRVLATWAETRPDTVFVAGGPEDPGPQGACDLTGALRDALAGADPASALQRGLARCRTESAHPQVGGGP